MSTHPLTSTHPCPTIHPSVHPLIHPSAQSSRAATMYWTLSLGAESTIINKTNKPPAFIVLHSRGKSSAWSDHNKPLEVTFSIHPQAPRLGALCCGQWGGLCGLHCSSFPRGIQGFYLLLKKLLFF